MVITPQQLLPEQISRLVNAYQVGSKNVDIGIKGNQSKYTRHTQSDDAKKRRDIRRQVQAQEADI